MMEEMKMEIHNPEIKLPDKLLRKLESGREFREMQFNAVDDNEKIVEGYATTFNQPYLLYEFDDCKVYEVVDSRAFVGCDLSDVIMQYDHMGRVFARNKNNTLSFTTDSVGFKIRGNLGGTELGSQIYEEIKGGYSDKMSISFTVAKDKRESIKEENGIITVTRTILQFKKIYDVSVVSIPANDMTSISARNLCDGLIAEIKAERLKRTLNLNKLKFLLEVNHGI